jgi:lipopolysaccharide assembly protein A
MHFLRTLFWVLVAVIVTFFAYRNWAPVTLNLWGDIQVDIKIPLLLLLFFLLGWVPTWLTMRARLWSYRRRLDAFERARAPTATAVPEPEHGEPGP